MILYVDTSSLAKTIISERGSAATRALLASASRVVTSELTGLELRRLHHRLGRADGHERTTTLMGLVDVVRIDADVLDEAGALPDPHLGALDAIHLASALRLGTALHSFVTHDETLAAAAERHGLSIASPD